MKSLNAFQLIKLTRQLITQISGLKERPWHDRAQIESYQLERIRAVVLDAKNHVPMYADKNLPDPRDIKTIKDVAGLPLLTKGELLGHEPQNRTNQKYDFKSLIKSTSSGSSGRALDVFYDDPSFNLFILAGLRMYQMAFSYYPWHRQTYIYTSPYPLNSLFGLYPLEFISTLNPIENTIDRLRKNPPDLLVCYPSHLRAIADKMTADDFKIIRPKAINVNSEMSSPAERKYLGELFQCFVFDDYSSEELTRIASQCRHQNYHIFDDINYIEIVDDAGLPLPEGALGHIVGTNLHNLGMPLIRYMQGDRGSIRTKKCDCGRNFRVLETLEGRKNDAFHLSTGETISSGYLLDLTYGVFLNYPGAVAAFCLIEESIDHWVLELVPGGMWSENLLDKIPAELRAALQRPMVRLEGQIVNEVRRTKTGKANPIISMIKKN